MGQSAEGAPIRVVTFGSDHPFTEPALRVLEGLSGFERVGHVVTHDERLFLRDPNGTESLRFVSSLRPDLFVSSGYGRILGEEALAIPAIGAVNVHPSLLPEFRGRDTVRWALYDGVPEIGVTIHEMTPSVDGGPILAQQSLPLRMDALQKPADLYAQLAALIPELLGRVLADIRRTGRIQGVPQSTGGSFHDFPRRDPSAVELDWSQSAGELIRRSRVFPGDVNLPAGHRRVYIDRIDAVSRPEDGRPAGTVVRRRLRTIDVVAGDQRTVRLVLSRPARAWVKLALAVLVGQRAG